MVNRSVRLFVCFTMLALACSGVFGAQQAENVALTILHTNDIHGHLFPFDYTALGKSETDVGGAARRATLLRQLKKTTKNDVLVMDAGDIFTRGPLSDLLGAPDFDVMNAVPYDIMTLGNNEFKGAEGAAGENVLRDRIKQAKFAIVCANVLDKPTGKTLMSEYKIVQVSGIKVGVFGLTAPRAATYEQTKNFEISDPIAAAKRIMCELRPKCDFIIALTHIGYPMDMMLASEVPGIDVIIGGDSHTWLFEPTLAKPDKPSASSWWVGGTIVCQDGEFGKTIGKLDLSLRLDSEHTYKVEHYTSKLIDVNSSIKSAPDIEQIIDNHAKPFSKPIGKLKSTISKNDAADWVAARFREAADTQIGIEPKEAVADGLRLGTVTELDIRKLFQFTNSIAKLTVTGKQLTNFLSETESGISGLIIINNAYCIDGNPIINDSHYTIAVEDFYAHNSPALSGAPITDLKMTTKEAITKFFSSHAGFAK